LIEGDDTIAAGIEKTARVPVAASARASMHEQRGLAARVAALLVINAVPVSDVEIAGGVGLDRRVQLLRAGLRPLVQRAFLSFGRSSRARPQAAAASKHAPGRGPSPPGRSRASTAQFGTFGTFRRRLETAGTAMQNGAPPYRPVCCPPCSAVRGLRRASAAAARNLETETLADERDDRLSGTDQAVRHPIGRRRPELQSRARRGARVPRTQRRRQDDDDAYRSEERRVRQGGR